MEETQTEVPVMEKITITKDSFYSLKGMLTSPDKSNSDLAFMALAKMDFASSKLFITLLYRVTQDQKSTWDKECKDHVKNIENLKLDNMLSMNSIFAKLSKDCSADELQVYFDQF